MKSMALVLLLTLNLSQAFALKHLHMGLAISLKNIEKLMIPMLCLFLFQMFKFQQQSQVPLF